MAWSKYILIQHQSFVLGTDFHMLQLIWELEVTLFDIHLSWDSFHLILGGFSLNL